MTSTPGPYGAYSPVPQPPRRYRPSAGWFVAGIALIVVAVVVAVGIFVWLLAGFLDTDATVRADGEPRQVSVGTDGDRMLWLDDQTTSCRIVDGETGAKIPVRTVTGSFERSDSNGDLVGLYRFSPGSGSLEVTCTSSLAGIGPAPVVLIGPMPQIGNFVVGILLAILIPGLLGLAGLVMLIVTGILWSVRDPRPKVS
ncbi:hypothetical protein [Nocardioides hungaricus]